MPTPSILRLAILASLISTLTACGSGGGTKDDDNGGGVVVVPDFQPPPSHPEWGYPRNAMNLNAAAPFTGQGVIVGILDKQPDLNYVPLQGQGAPGNPYVNVSGGTNIEGEADHGTAVATVLLGKPWGAFQGGVAPGARLLFTDYGTPANIRAMTDRGMRVFNQSVQTDVLIGGNSNQAQIDYFNSSGLTGAYRYLRDQGGIVIHAAGNARGANPSTGAGVPYYFPDITNWIAVVALDMQGKEIASYSNRCGVMANYCLAAPGTWRLVWPTPGQPAGYSYRWTGTSFAAPAVAGAAALVYEAFPWMSGTQVAQTLFTTARDMGAPGVDDVYGWGAVDAGRAVLGPAQLTSSWAASIPEGMSSTFANDISGAGSLDKSGGGTLTLTGTNTWTGGTSLSDGNLFLDGSLSGNLHQSDGRFGGTGTLFGDLQQTGGGLALTPGAPLTVSGTANVSGDITLRAPENFSGQAVGQLINAGSLTWTSPITLSQDSLFLAGALDPVSTAGLSGSLWRTSGEAALSAAGVGDGASAQGARMLDSTLAALDAQSQGGAGFAAQLNTLTLADDATLDQISAQAHGSVRDLALSQARSQQLALSARVRDAAQEGGGAWAMVVGRDTRLRTPQGLDADVDGTSAWAGIDHDLDGTSGGWAVGGAVGASQNDARFDRGGGAVESDQSTAVGYVAWRGDEHVFTGWLSVGRLHQDVSRPLRNGDGSFIQVDSSPRAWLTQASLAHEWQFSPRFATVARLDHDRLRSDAFAESLTHPLALSGQASTTTRTEASFGLRAQDTWGAWSGSLLGLYGYRLDRDASGFNASFQGLPGTFGVWGVTPGRHVRTFEGRLLRNMGNGWNGYLEAIHATDGEVTTREARAGVRKDF